MCRFHSLLLECCECNVKCVVEVCLPNSRLLTTHSVNITNIQAYNTFYRHILVDRIYSIVIGGASTPITGYVFSLTANKHLAY